MSNFYLPVRTLIVLSILLMSAATGAAQVEEPETEAAGPQTLDLFLDCQTWCHESYLRQEITFVNFVRNKDVADLHLLITRESTGSGGQEFTLRFLGEALFNGGSDTLRYISSQSDTQNEQRIGLARYIKIGLLPFLRDTGVLGDMEVTYEGTGESGAQSASREDPWNNWVFELNGNTRLNGEETESQVSINGRAEASRVTEDWKLRFNYRQDYTRRKFVRDEETNIYITENFRGSALAVKSLGRHWSAGTSANIYSSTRQNVDLSYSGSAALEYSVFPYSEYSEREITFLYRLSAGYYDYSETTIFEKNSEHLMQQRLESRMNFTQPWGEIEGRLNASAFMHDLNKNRVDVNLEFNFRIIRGLSFNVSGRYAWINDQLGVPAGDIDDAEQLLDLRQQLTSYSYGASVGIEWTFGSIYNNVVNPRF